MKVNFTVENRARKTLTAYRVDYEGDGTFGLEVPSLESFEHEYTQEGLFPATVVARDNAGTEYICSFMVNVHPLPPLKSKWEKMKAALAAGELDGAVKYYRDKDEQRAIFAEVRDLSLRDPTRLALGEIAAQMANLEIAEVRGDRAECWLTRQEPVNDAPRTISYPAYFLKTMDGFWLLERF